MLLPPQWEVPAPFRERLGETAGRQRAMEADGHLLVIIHRVPTPGVSKREGILFWRNPEGAWRTTGRGVGVQSLRGYVEDYAAAVEQLENRLEKADEAAEFYEVLQASTPIHRALIHMHAALQSARDMIKQDRDLISLRDRAGDIERAAELLHHDAVHRLNYAMARRSEDLARSSHQLNAVGTRINQLAALFLPITAIASIFGMNLYSGLESIPGIFYIILIAGIASGILINRAFASPPPNKPLPDLRKDIPQRPRSLEQPPSRKP